MIKILHTGDIHLGDLAGPTKDGENLRRLDTLKCMDTIVETARAEGPHLSIIAGDLFNRSRVWADTALDDVNDALERFIRPLCEYSDAVVLLFGTMNHDNPRAFEVIRKAAADLDNLHIYTTPTLETLSVSGEAVDIVAVPGFDKARLRLFCPGADKETENRNATALVNDIILGLASKLDHKAPAILVSHYTVSGSEADNGSTFLAGQDVVILPSTIDAAGVDLACFGHIHKPQKLVSTTPAYYCGSPNQLTFNDEGTEHGFWMHTIQEEIVHSAFIRTPERRHFTLKMSEKDVTDFISSGEYSPPEAVAGAVVRVRYTCTPEQDKAMNRAALQKLLTDAGAFYVAEIIPENIEDLDAKDNLTEHDGPAECLSRWMELNEVSGEKAARLKIQELTPQAELERELLSERVRLNNEAAEARRRIIGYRADIGQYKSIIDRKAEIEAAQAALADLTPQLQAAHLRMAEAQKTAEAKRKAKAAVDGHVADSRVRIGELEARLKAAQAEAGKLEDSGCPNPGTATCKFLVSAVAAQAAIPELSTVLEQTKIDDRAKYAELVDAYNEAKAKDEAMGDPAAEIMELSAAERKYREVADLAPRLAAAQAGIEKIESSISNEQGKAEQAEARVHEIDTELATLAVALEEYRAARETVAANEHKADMLAVCEAAAAKAEALAPQIERLQSDMAELMEKSSQAEKEAGEIRARIPASTGDPDGLRLIVKTHRQTVTNYATLRGEISAKLKAITEAEAQTAELRREVEAVGVTLNDYTTLVQAFDIDGIQYMIIRGVVPEIMRQSNDILTAMTGGRMAVDFRTEREQKSTKTIVNSLEVWINTITGGTRPYQSHSGGEKVKIALAVTLGLADVKARRAGIQLGMLFIDEPPFLDADGTEAYADALVSMAARNPNMRILAISHDPTMKARFSQNIIVTAGEDGSTVSME